MVKENYVYLFVNLSRIHESFTVRILDGSTEEGTFTASIAEVAAQYGDSNATAKAVLVLAQAVAQVAEKA